MIHLNWQPYEIWDGMLPKRSFLQFWYANEFPTKMDKYPCKLSQGRIGYSFHYEAKDKVLLSLKMAYFREGCSRESFEWEDNRNSKNKMSSVAQDQNLFWKRPRSPWYPHLQFVVAPAIELDIELISREQFRNQIIKIWEWSIVVGQW